MNKTGYAKRVKEQLAHKPAWCVRDALANYDDFAEHEEVMRKWVRHFREDPWLRVGKKCHNAEGTLGGMAWVMGAALQPDRCSLYPCFDFNEDSQTVFLRRGLREFLALLLEEEAAAARERGRLAEGQFELELAGIKPANKKAAELLPPRPS